MAVVVSRDRWRVIALAALAALVVCAANHDFGLVDLIGVVFSFL